MQLGGLHQRASETTLVICGLALVVFGFFLYQRVNAIGTEIAYTQAISGEGN